VDFGSLRDISAHMPLQQRATKRYALPRVLWQWQAGLTENTRIKRAVNKKESIEPPINCLY
jgi:hypothetical protein